MRITTKGQVTIPVEIQEKLRLLPNSEVGELPMKRAEALRRASRV